MAFGTGLAGMSRGEVRRGGCGLSTWGKDHYYASATFTFCLDRYHQKKRGDGYWIVLQNIHSRTAAVRSAAAKEEGRGRNHVV